MTQPLSQGLWGVLATPFDDGLDVDLDSLRSEVASFADDGAQGLVALGVFGESAVVGLLDEASVAHSVARDRLPFVLGASERTVTRSSHRRVGCSRQRRACRSR